jgi:uncharacterized cupredoxin-like copper-binding protein
MNIRIKMMAMAALAIGCVTVQPAFARGEEPAGHAAHAHEHAEIGRPGNAKEVTRTIAIDMNDNMRFQPSSIRVKRGDVVRFVVSNSGKLKHELVIGDMGELKEHAEMMRKFPGMEHDEPNQVAVAPGQRGTLIWRFDKAGTVTFACLQPGHFEAGMQGSVVVDAKN